MSGINTGILSNAYPLTTEQIKELEKWVLETQETIAYLDEQGKLCFIGGPFDPEGIKDLAWNRAYDLSIDSSGTLNKKGYKKEGLNSFYLKATMQKQDMSEAWKIKTVGRTTFQLADGCAFITNDNLIFEI
jgi:hypothetical protein